jgi:hypothetical protein
LLIAHRKEDRGKRKEESEKTGVRMNLPQFDGHFRKEYTTNLKGVSNEKVPSIFKGI